MAIEEIDLTLSSHFATDTNKNLLLRHQFEYYQNNENYKKSYERIISKNPQPSISMFIGLIEPSILDDDVYKCPYETPITTFEKIFDASPKYEKFHTYYDYFNGNSCERCGTNLHMLNSVRFGLCIDCEHEINDDVDSNENMIGEL